MKRTRWILVVIAALVIALLWWLRDRSRSEDHASQATAGNIPANGGGSVVIARPDRHAGEPASLAGTVKTKAGAPIGGAWVCARAYDDDVASDRRDPRCTTAGSDGAWKIDDLFAAHYSVDAGAEGMIPASYDAPDDLALSLHAGEAKTGIDLVLADHGALVSGTVLDLTGGAIEGALVSVGSGFGGPRGTCFTHSAAGGAFRCWVGPGGGAAHATADGYTDDQRYVDAPEDGVKLYLTPESTLDGTVVTADTHEPVPDARVDARGAGWSAGTTTTDAQGHFHLAHLAPDRYKPTATAPGLYGEAAESVLVGLAQGKDGITIEVHPAATVHGIVKLGDQPVGDCYVELAGTGPGAYSKGNDDDGTVMFDAVQPGKYTVTVGCDHETPQTYPPLVVADQPLDETWPVDAGATLTGSVVDSAGAPIARAEVMVYDALHSGSSQDRTDDDGKFTLRGLRAGPAKLSAMADGHPSLDQPMAIEVGKDQDVRVVLPDGGALTGKVVTASGAPVPDVGVAATGRGGRFSGGGGSEAQTHADGTFEMRGLRPGDYRVTAMRDWRPLRKPGTTDDDKQGEKVTLAAGASANVTITVEDPSGTITGKVLDASGAPVGDAFLRAVRESDAAGASPSAAAAQAHWGWGKQPAVTGTDGTFTIDDLSPGHYTVLAYREGGTEAKAEHVAVGASVTLSIARGGSLAGAVTTASSGAPRQVTITVQDRRNGIDRSESFFMSGGAWAIRDLPAGTYDLGAVAPDGKARLAGVVLGDGEDKTGVDIALAATVDVTGRLVDADTHAPIPNVRVFVMPAGGGMGLSRGDIRDPDHVTKDDGRFGAHDVAPGMTSIFVIDSDAKYRGALRRVDVEGSGTVDLGDVEVRASRIPKGGEPGDLGFTLQQRAPDVDPANAKLEIASVAKGGPAAAAGLEVGDVIVSVDGHDVTGDHATDYGVLANVTAGTTVTFGLARGASLKITAGPSA